MTRVENKPLGMMDANLKLVNKGEMPIYGIPELLPAMHLEGENPDGLTLVERLRNPEGLTGKITFGKKVIKVLSGTVNVLDRITEGKSTGSDEELAKILSGVATAQIRREGNICPGAMDMAWQLLTVRPDYLPDDVKATIARIKTEEILGKLLALELLIELQESSIKIIAHRRKRPGK